MTQSRASGEQAALAGYRWQYDHIAELVYDALLEEDFVSVRLVDPDVGQADDLILMRHGRVDAYQFRSGGGPLTFRRLALGKTTRGGKRAPSLARSLAQGWRFLQSRHASEHVVDVQVHLVTEQPASLRDEVRQTNGKPTPRHFAAFLDLVLRPLRLGQISLEHVDSSWRPKLGELQEECGLDDEDSTAFLRSLRIECNAGSGLPGRRSSRWEDIEELSGRLQRFVSNSSGVVSVDRQQLLELMGWTNRTSLRSRHEFPVDLDTYEPLSEAIQEVRDRLNRQDSGFIALLGPPGSGKSTLLSQALTTAEDRVIHYFAFVPGDPLGRSRLSAESFLHDLVILLRKAGLRSHGRQLLGTDLHELRRQLADQLDEANAEFEDRGVRTIVVVDGLDHVDRERLGTDGLLSQLPHPGEMRPGVIFVVGTRTLAPLRPEVQQVLEETSAVVDLREHRLSATSVLAICRRVPAVSALSEEAHNRIAELCDGHPLYLNYLLKRVSVVDVDDADDILSNAPPYEGDIAGLYRAAWEDIEADQELIEILGVCSRLRIGFTTNWLSTWTSRQAVRKFRLHLLYLFHQDPNGWRFFHDSFRQFVVDRTALGDHGSGDVEEDAAIHARIANLCAQAAENRLAAEQLYHRHLAGQMDHVLEIGTQQEFRAQFRGLRSAELIRSDIGTALQVAAERQDLSNVFRLLLSLAELESRQFALREIEMPSLLYESGLVDEAISSCAGALGEVRLAHAYDLAWRLGLDGDSAGRRIFESIAHHGVDERDQIVVMGQEDDTAVAWTRCAGLYRPLPLVLDAIAEQGVGRKETGQHRRREQEEVLRRYASMMKAIIEVITAKGDLRSLESIDAALAKRAAELKNTGNDEAAGDSGTDTRDIQRAGLASTVGLRVRVVDSILGLLNGTESRQGRIRRLRSSAIDMPSYPSTRLRLAELLEREGLATQASEELARTRYETSITVDSLTRVRGGTVLEERFRYWCLRYRLAADIDHVPASVAPSPKTPAGDHINADAPIHSDRGAIQMAAQFDALVRDLARIDGQSRRGARIQEEEAWSVIERCLIGGYGPGIRRSAMVELMSSHLPELARISARVASDCSASLAQRVSDEIERQLGDNGGRPSLTLLLELAESLKAGGAKVSWERDVLVAHESSLKSEDIHSKLDETVDLIRRYVRAESPKEAQRLVLGLRPASFAVGMRKDYQFDEWVQGLGRAIGEPGGEQLVASGAWLARLLTAVEPMAERAPRSAAANLPAAVVPGDPVAAVRLFEYLVRQGTVRHVDALAKLIQALVEYSGCDDEEAIRLAADVTGDMLGAASYQAHPELATAIVAAADRVVGSAFASELAESIASQTDVHGLPTSRASWRAGLGLPTDSWPQPEEEGRSSSQMDTFSLLLSDGTRIAEHDVPSQVSTVDEIVSLRRRESSDSKFRWAPVIASKELDEDDLSKLLEAFPCDQDCDPDVIAQLAIVGQQCGDDDAATALARESFGRARGDTWAPFLGGTRLIAAGVLARCGDSVDREAIYKDLANQAIELPGLPGQLVLYFEELDRALKAEVSAKSTWSAIQMHLEGMAQVLDLGKDDPLGDHRSRWWLSSSSVDLRDEEKSDTIGAALAELLVGHIAHPSWILREAASRVVIRALGRGNDEVAHALARFAGHGSSHDLLERAGRCVAGARVRFGIAVPSHLEELDRVLANHTSQALRELASTAPNRPWRDLEPAYWLELPAGASEVVDPRFAKPDPYESRYRVLAESLNLDLSSVKRVAMRHASTALDSFPADHELKAALKGAVVEHSYPLDEAAARRAAFGHVVADLRDAGLLDLVPDDVSLIVRMTDLELLGRTPQPRPSSIPALPPAGHEQTCQLWLAGTESRLRDYLASADSETRVLIGATVNLRVMNWGLLNENVICGTTIGTVDVSEDEFAIPVPSASLSDLCARADRGRFVEGEPLLIENQALTFHQNGADWLAFRPELATALGWSPDPDSPGRWFTAGGDLAVETVWWADGYWGRTGRAFDDAVAAGYAVEMTKKGVAALSKETGELMRHFRLARSGLDDGAKMGPETVVISQPLR